jgi:hypothetical protein
VETLKSQLRDCGFRVESTHHFSLRQNPFGWVQSALNKFRGLPRNGLYELLHAKRAGQSVPIGWVARWGLLAAFAVGMPVGLALEMLATLFRTGATVHVVARAE